MCDELVHIEPYSLEFIVNHFKTQEICNEAARIEKYLHKFVLDHLKNQKMCNEVMHIRPAAFFLSLTKTCVLE